MLKQLFLYLLLSMNLCAVDNDKSKNSSTSTTMIVVYCVGGAAVIVGGVLAAPLVLPASTVLAIQTSAVTAGTSVATPYAQGVSYGISAGRIVRPYVVQTIEERLNQFLKKEAVELREVKTNFTTCLMKHKSDTQRDDSGYPTACEDIAFTFAILAGEDEFNKVIKIIQ